MSGFARAGGAADFSGRCFLSASRRPAFSACLGKTTRCVRLFASAIGLALLWRYAWWRTTTTLPPAELSVDFIFGVMFLALELGGIVSATVSGITLSRTSNRSREADANAQWLANEARFPLVDALICTYNEEEAILERTIVGAMAMDIRTSGLGARRRAARVAAGLCDRLGCGYITRAENTHAKAGNINHALGQSRTLRPRAEFITVSTPISCRCRNFLDRARGAVSRPDVGLVQTPQNFVNPDPVQVNLGAERLLPDEQRFFFDVVCPPATPGAPHSAAAPRR